jgi:hypothetical protein
VFETNPYADGKIRGHRDAIIRAIVIGIANRCSLERTLCLVLAYRHLRSDHVRARYCLSNCSICAKRTHRRRIEAEEAGDFVAGARKLYPELEAEANATKEFKATLSAMNEAHKKKSPR